VSEGKRKSAVKCDEAISGLRLWVFTLQEKLRIGKGRRMSTEREWAGKSDRPRCKMMARITLTQQHTPDHVLCIPGFGQRDDPCQ
jgi:hypothetical protein